MEETSNLVQLQDENGKDITRVRKDIARVYTVLRERELGIK